MGNRVSFERSLVAVVLTVVDPVAQVTLPSPLVQESHEGVDVRPAGATPHYSAGGDHRQLLQCTDKPKQRKGRSGIGTYILMKYCIYTHRLLNNVSYNTASCCSAQRNNKIVIAYHQCLSSMPSSTQILKSNYISA